MTGISRGVLCIDINTSCQNVLFRYSGADFSEMPRFVLPSPSEILARRITDATMRRRDIFLAGPAMGREFLPALSGHVRQGCRAALDERTALTLYKTREDAESAGMDVLEFCPDGYMFIPTGDVDMSFWRGLCRMLALEELPLTAVAALDTGEGHPAGNGACSGSMWFWQGLLREYAQTGVPPEAFILAEVPESMPRLRAIQAATKGYVTDAGVASLLGLLGDAAIFERSFRQGVVLLQADDVHVTAFLVWRGNVYGMYEHHAQSAPVDRVVHDLSEFRLGWLPDESVRDSGGHGTAFAVLPPEAEGFPATFVTGKRARLFAEYGKLSGHAEQAFTGCRGLAFAADLAAEHAGEYT